jgi:xanthine/uracil permease
MDRFAGRLLFVVVWVCSAGAVTLFTLAQFGWLAATLVAIPMTILIGATVLALSRAAGVAR